MPLSIRMMTPDDIPAANAIAMAAYKRGSRAAELALYLALQPDGWLRHMRLGSAPQHACRARIFGQASFAIG